MLLKGGLIPVKVCKVLIVWDNGIWYAKTDEELGLSLESGSFDALVEHVRIVLPEMLELNCGYTGPFQIAFKVERVDIINAVG